jgi:hypothetical protein
MKPETAVTSNYSNHRRMGDATFGDPFLDLKVSTKNKLRKVYGVRIEKLYF